MKVEIGENDVAVKVLNKVGCWKLVAKQPDGNYAESTCLMLKVKAGKQKYVIGFFGTEKFIRSIWYKYTDVPQAKKQFAWRMPEELTKYISGSEHWVLHLDKNRNSIFDLHNTIYAYLMDNTKALHPENFDAFLNKHLKYMRGTGEMKEIKPQFPTKHFVIPETGQDFDLDTFENIKKAAQTCNNKFFMKTIF